MSLLPFLEGTLLLRSGLYATVSDTRHLKDLFYPSAEDTIGKTSVCLLNDHPKWKNSIYHFHFHHLAFYQAGISIQRITSKLQSQRKRITVNSWSSKKGGLLVFLLAFPDS